MRNRRASSIRQLPKPGRFLPHAAQERCETPWRNISDTDSRGGNASITHGWQAAQALEDREM